MRLRRQRGFEGRFPTDGISRPIGDLRRFPAFDGLRAIAAVLVVAVHSAFFSGFSLRSSLGNYTSRLEIGVSVFFVISGFLLYRPFAVAHLAGDGQPRASRFWVRRVFRIIPAYWLALTVLFYVFHLVTISGGWKGTVVQYLLLQIYFPTTYYSGIAGAWSLCVELSFYLFLPLYALAVAHRRRGADAQLRREILGLTALIAIGLAYRVWVLAHHPSCGTHCLTDPALTAVMGTWLPAFFDLFAIGMLLAVISAWFVRHESEPTWLRHRAMPWVSWSLALLMFWAVSHLGIPSTALYSVSPVVNIERQTLYGLFGLFLVAPSVFGPQGQGAIRRALQLAPVAWLGVASYGIYLWHAALIQAFFRVTGRPEFGVSFLVLFATVLAVSTAVASASYLGVEQPLLEFANRVTRRRAAAADAERATSHPDGRSVDEMRPDAQDSKTPVRTLGWTPADVALRCRLWSASLGARWFFPGLLAIVGVAIAVRVGFAAGWTFGRTLPGDATFFRQAAASLAAGHGYAVRSFITPGHLQPTAQHPPLFSMLLASFDLLGIHSVDAQRVLVGIVASLGVFLTGLVGHRVAGPAVGLAAAGIAALQPLWFQPSAALMSESLYLVLVPAILLLALRCADRPGRKVFVVLGGAVGLAVLTRSDALGLAVFLGVPLVLLATRSGRARLSFARCFLAGLLLVLTPWLLRNEVRLGGVALSDNQGVTLVGSYCPQAIDPTKLEYGGFDGTCAEAATGYLITKARPPGNSHTWNELRVSNALTSSTGTWIRAHLGELPRLWLARVENTWGLARTRQQLYVAQIEGRVGSFERLGLELGRLALPFELIGAIVLARRSKRHFFVFLAPLLTATCNSALFYGSTRILAVAQPALAVLAAIGVVAAAVAVARLVRERRRRPLDQFDVAIPLAGADAETTEPAVAAYRSGSG